MRQTTLRPRISQSLSRAARLLVLVSALGCAVTSGDVYLSRKLADESFGYESIQAQGLGVLGVTSADFDVPGTTATTDWLGPWFLSELQSNRSDLELISPKDIAAALGVESFVRTLDTHSESTALDSATLGDLAAALTRPRYIVVARVDSDSVENTYSFSEQDEYDTSCTVLSAHMRARAIVRVRFQIYDLKARRQVWEGVCRSEKDRKATKFVGRRCSDAAESLVQSLLYSFMGIDNDDEVFVEYPDPPKFSEVLCPCFKRFAQRLPAAAEHAGPYRRQS